MWFLYVLTGIALLISFVKDRKKTGRAVVIAAKRFLDILPAFVMLIAMVAVFLTLVPDSLIVEWLGTRNMVRGVAVAIVLGSITLMPGFIAFPLCGILLQKGVSYFVISAFTTTMMMVGLVTYPIEKKYLGIKLTIVRNLISLLIALIVAVITGFFFHELSLPWHF